MILKSYKLIYMRIRKNYEILFHKFVKKFNHFSFSFVDEPFSLQL